MSASEGSFFIDAIPMRIINGKQYTTGIMYRVPSAFTDAGASQHPRIIDRKIGKYIRIYLTLCFLLFRSDAKKVNAGIKLANNPFDISNANGDNMYANP